VLLLVFFKPLLAALREDHRLRVLLAWVGLVLLFFTISAGKREVYIFPALPMLALVVGVLWTRVREQGLGGRTGAAFQGFLYVFATGLAAVGAVLFFAPERLTRKVPEYAEGIATLAVPLTAMGLTLLMLLVVVRRRDLLQRLAVASLTVWVFVSLLVWPRVDPYRTPRGLMEQVERILPATSALGLVRFKEQFLLFSHRPLTHFSYLAPLTEQERNAWVWMREAPNRHLLLPTDAELTCFDLGQAVSLGAAHRREWVLLGTAAMRTTCTPPERVQRFIYRPDPRGVLP
jgi:4-amino-4-deoxy-L-arabinose transferase-like glycosyltransferase